MMLAMMGNDIRTTYDGEQAVAAAVEFQPHVILLDIGLPKISGYEACRRIREQTNGTRPIIIAQTGWGQDADRTRTRDAGFDLHLVKPVNPKALMRTLHEYALQPRP
jgi:DNA-binding response OmpR family regulator